MGLCESFTILLELRIYFYNVFLAWFTGPYFALKDITVYFNFNSDFKEHLALKGRVVLFLPIKIQKPLSGHGHQFSGKLEFSLKGTSNCDTLGNLKMQPL